MNSEENSFQKFKQSLSCFELSPAILLVNFLPFLQSPRKFTAVNGLSTPPPSPTRMSCSEASLNWNQTRNRINTRLHLECRFCKRKANAQGARLASPKASDRADKCTSIKVPIVSSRISSLAPRRIRDGDSMSRLGYSRRFSPTGRQADAQTDEPTTRSLIHKAKKSYRIARRPRNRLLEVVSSSSSLNKRANSRPVLFSAHLHSLGASVNALRASCHYFALSLFPPFSNFPRFLASRS